MAIYFTNNNIIILVFGICIHSEIIIVNKYGLNENTKKRFDQTGDEDYQLAHNFVRGSANSLDDNDEEKIIQNKRTLSKEIKKMKSLKLI